MSLALLIVAGVADGQDLGRLIQGSWQVESMQLGGQLGEVAGHPSDVVRFEQGRLNMKLMGTDLETEYVIEDDTIVYSKPGGFTETLRIMDASESRLVLAVDLYREKDMAKLGPDGVVMTLQRANGDEAQQDDGAAYSDLAKTILISACEESPSCVTAVQEQFDACHARGARVWIKYMQAPGLWGGDKYLNAYNKKVLPCFEDPDGNPIF